MHDARITSAGLRGSSQALPTRIVRGTIRARWVVNGARFFLPFRVVSILFVLAESLRTFRVCEEAFRTNPNFPLLIYFASEAVLSAVLSVGLAAR